MAWAAAIVWGSYLPSKDIPSAAIGQDRWIHVFMYGVLAILAYRWRREIRLTTVGCAVFASIQEPLQGLSRTREANWDDWLFNIVGIALAAGMVALATQYRKRKSQAPS